MLPEFVRDQSTYHASANGVIVNVENHKATYLDGVWRLVAPRRFYRESRHGRLSSVGMKRSDGKTRSSLLVEELLTRAF